MKDDLDEYGNPYDAGAFNPILEEGRVYLPRQCVDYEIGGIEEVDRMIEKLQEIRAAMVLRKF